MIARLTSGLVLAFALTLAGCAPSSPARTYSPTAASELQSVVLSLSEAASVGDHAAAAGSLDQLEAATIAAFSRGELSDARFDAIMAAIALVRDDLETALAREAEATREPAPSPSPTDSGAGTSSGSTGTGGSTGGSTGTSGSSGGEAEPGNGNGRGNGGEPGPPDDRGKPGG
ncbi:hypothetical protein GCM10009792_06840 [Microcella alkalica]|uniref:Putative membrane protein YgcG n=1 Tax=Microcella alkalica TaxID=355930 RepID=A0A839E667_9MICO|nr:hypothetical protein [Microcella alkalica]MBA8846806.1 putative membrane protein YgcG [Microcella alkalica]